MFSSCCRTITVCSTIILAFSAADTLAQEIEPGFDVQVTMYANNATPEAQQPIELVIEVENIGENMAENVVVEYIMPSELAIPAGMVPSTSLGDYDALSGTWNIGEIIPGDVEFLTIPAVVQASPQPACIINEVEFLGEDTDNGNNMAVVTIRLPGVECCTDLSIWVVDPIWENDYCGGTASVGYEIAVRNYGPEDASDVVLQLTETSSFKLPGFQFVTDVDACSGLECRWQSIPAYHYNSLYAESIEFRNEEKREHGIRLVITTADEDYEPENNFDTKNQLIPSFTTPCDDNPYNLPDSVVIGVGDGGGGGCFIINLF